MYAVFLRHGNIYDLGEAVCGYGSRGHILCTNEAGLRFIHQSPDSHRGVLHYGVGMDTGSVVRFLVGLLVLYWILGNPEILGLVRIHRYCGEHNPGNKRGRE